MQFPSSPGLRHRATVALYLLLAVLVVVSAGCGGGSTSKSQATPSPNPQPSIPPPPPDFTLVLLPDTQYYSHQRNGATLQMFSAATVWVAAHRQQDNILAVVGLGDIVHCAANEDEWRAADSAYRVLDAAPLPYLPLLGNHDYDGECGNLSAGRSAKKYNEYFGPSRLAAYPWYGGSTFPSASHENFFITFESGSAKFLVLGLEFYPRDAALAWAQQVVDSNRDRQVIVSTHACVNVNSEWIRRDQPKGPLSYGLSDGNDGEQLWTKFVRKNQNIIMVVNGHLHGVGRLVRQNDAGKPVPQMLSNFQHEENGGNGFIRLLRFRPSTGEVDVTTYSPYLDQFRTDADNQFTVSYK